MKKEKKNHHDGLRYLFRMVCVPVRVRLYLVPNLLVRSPMKTDLMSFPKDAALTGSSFCSWQCSR